MLRNWFRRKDTPAPPFEPPNDGKIRLNLGCGDKLLKGCLNVDIAADRKGVKPDLECDLRKVPLPTNYADEIYSVHVIEHFYYWEVEEVLNEWIRLLKAGGKLIVECPNLEEAARELLAHPESAGAPGKGGQRTMWIFYGDPGWKDPLMIHRWGYTPRSLKELLEKVGLQNVRQEKAMFKKREPRDMRITGEKPLSQ